MKNATLVVIAGATLLWARTALAAPDAEDNCAKARVGAWKTYVSCVDTTVAKDYVGAFDNSGPEWAAFARCRHAYFRKWTRFQDPRRRPSLAGSTCIGARFTDNGDQ